MKEIVNERFEECLAEAVRIAKKYEIRNMGTYGDAITVAVVEIAKFLYKEYNY